MVTPPPAILLADAFNLAQEKWDWALPASLLHSSFASLKLDIPGAHDWIKSHWTGGLIRRRQATLAHPPT